MYLIRPNQSNCYQDTIKDRAIEMPLWLLLMSNLFRNARIIDAEAENLSNEQVKDIVKDNKAIILATGSHPSAHVQALDSAQELSKCLTDAHVYNWLFFNPLNVGCPDYSKLDLNKYRTHDWHCPDKNKRSPYASIFTSISCPFDCNFCTIKSFYNSPYKKRHTSLVVEDVYTLYRLGVRNIKIMDELFLVMNNSIETLGFLLSDIGKEMNMWGYARIDTVNKKNLKSAKKMGVTWLGIGIESGNESIRNDMLKGKFRNERIKEVVKMIQDAGIKVGANYIFGFWEDTLETMQETLDFAKELNTEYANFYCLNVYPGTPIENNFKEIGVDMPTKSIEHAQLSEYFKPFPTKTLTGKQVLNFRDNAYKEYYNTNNILRRIYG